MTEITLEEKKSILLNMLIEIDKFCNDNNLNYYLAGGTLLGAIRHKGFIPWDDDIDIAMPRDDYNRFCQTFISSSGDLQVLDFKNTNNYIWAAAKVINKKTVLIENDNTRHAIGLFVDVFPLDKLHGTKSEVIKKQKKIQFWKNFNDIRFLKWKKDRPIYKNIIVSFAKVLRLVPTNIILKHIEALSIRDNSYDECNYISICVGAWGIREITKIDNFKYPAQTIFEGKQYSIPNGYDDYLKTLYGDYMTPPPKEKQLTHHGNKVYWKER